MKKIIIVCLAMFCIHTLIAQESNIRINGVVLDEFDDSLPGANVFLKDRSTVGVMTDLDGRFNLRAEEGDVLVITFLGYKRKEIRLQKSESDIVVKLEPDSQQMDEVVVEAFGMEKRRVTATGAITSVDVSTLQTPATSVANMLGGRVAGIIATQASGEPGKNISEFWIRGIGTFGASSSALVLIDGLEGSIDNIDPADIESFSILKDASATAVYGVRGANGVVLVTTKRGKSDKPEFTFRANLKLSQLRRLPDYLGGYDYAKLANEANIVRGGEALYSDMELDIIKNGLDPDFYPDVNWQNELLKKNSFKQTYYVSARGGGSIARYFVSLNMTEESAIYKQDKNSKYFNDVAYNTYGFRSNIDLNVTPTTEIYFGTDIALIKNNLPGGVDTDQLWAAQAKLTPVIMPLVYSDGRLPAYSLKDDEISPYVQLNHTGNKSISNFTGTYTLNLKQDLGMILSGLKLNVQGAYTNQSYFTETRRILPELWYISYRTADNELAGVRQSYRVNTQYSKDEWQYRKYYLQSNLNYSQQIGNHYFGALIHYEMSDYKYSNVYSSDGMEAIPIRYQGISGRLSYNYDETYLLDVNMGYTGSENFQPGRRFGFFPSISGGWVPSSYAWTKENLPWMKYFKIRASYGLVGNDRLINKRFPYLTTVSQNGSHSAWGNIKGTISELYMGADNLQWEKSKKMDIGIEGNIFDRVSFEVDFFKDIRDGIYQQREQVPDYIGLVNMPYGNTGKMKSWGSDGSVSYTHKINKNVDIIFRGNFTYSVNKVDYFEEADNTYEYMSSSGRPYGYQKGYISLGLFKDEADVANSPSQSSLGAYMAGDIKYKDVNGDGIINSDDRVPLAFSNYPRLMYGFGTEVRYKQLTLSVLFKGRGNTTFYHTGNGYDVGYLPFYNGELGNVVSMVADPSNRWIPADYDDPSIPGDMRENPNAKFPRLNYGRNNNNSQVSDFWRGNSRYLRLEEVNISYNWNSPLLKKIKINSVNFSLVGQNLAVWSPEKTFDPEQAHYNGLVYPLTTSYTFQMYINF